jgi:uncharacterized protein YxeA
MKYILVGILIFALAITIFFSGCVSENNVDNFNEVDDLQNITNEEEQISTDLSELSNAETEDTFNNEIEEIDSALKELDTLLEEPSLELN